MAKRRHVSIPDYQDEWLEQESISPSKLFQEAVDDRMKEYGFDIETWKNAFGE